MKMGWSRITVLRIRLPKMASCTSLPSVWQKLTRVTIRAMYQHDQCTAKRLRASSRIQAKKSQPSQMRGAHSGLRVGGETAAGAGGVAVAMELVRVPYFKGLGS